MDDDQLLWPTPPADISLDWQAAHVWAVPLQISNDAQDHLAKMLTPEERRRAQSFHFDRHRSRFIAGRGMLRTILGHYLHTGPGFVWFEYGRNGKPLLAERFARSGLQFNLAHCEDLALLAVTRGRVIGIDLEQIRTMDDAWELAAIFCSPREYEDFLALPPADKDAAFFRLWTRKEAWLKATGKGIGESLDKVEVTLREGEAARFVRLPEVAGTPASGWTLQELTPAAGFIAALALPGEAAETIVLAMGE